MQTYLIQFDLELLSERLSCWLGCRVSVADVREVLCRIGLRESYHGWLTHDLRPLLLAYVRPGDPLFPAVAKSRAA